MNFETWIESFSEAEMKTIFEDGENWRKTGTLPMKTMLNIKAFEYHTLINEGKEMGHFYTNAPDVILKQSIVNAVTRQLYLKASSKTDEDIPE